MPERVSARLSLVTVVVDDYDRAIDFYCRALGFHLAEDTPLALAKRWVVVKPEDRAAMGLLLAVADDEQQRRAIGRQTGGRVGFFLEVDDFDAAHRRMRAEGVHFEEEPREEPYAKVAVFRDLYGNRWDLLSRHGS